MLNKNDFYVGSLMWSILNAVEDYVISNVILVTNKDTYELSWDDFEKAFNPEIKELPDYIYNLQFHADDQNVFFEFEREGYDYYGVHGALRDQMIIVKHEKIKEVKKKLSLYSATKFFAHIK